MTGRAREERPARLRMNVTYLAVGVAALLLLVYLVATLLKPEWFG